MKEFYHITGTMKTFDFFDMTSLTKKDTDNRMKINCPVTTNHTSRIWIAYEIRTSLLGGLFMFNNQSLNEHLTRKLLFISSRN